MPTHQQQQQLDPELFIGFMGILGRNGSDSSFLIPERQCLEALNVDWYRSALGRKRGGAIDIVTGFTAVAGYRHVPADDVTLAEAWAMDNTGVLHRYSGGAWSIPTMVDACTASPQETNFQSFNGKLYIAYKSAHNRLHVWDPADNKVRRTGLDLPAQLAAPALAGGAITDTRRYRITWAVQSGGITVKRSNLSLASASVVYAAQQGTFTRGAAPGEGETHWELWGASTATAFGDYRLVATTVIATTTAVDNAALGATVSPLDGANTPPPSARYLAADDSRIIMGGAWELATNAENAMTPKTARLWWTSLLTASGVGDDERVSNTGTINSYADLEESIAGLSQPMQLVSAAANSLERGSFYVFSSQSQWKFVSTSDSTAPYLKFRVTGGRGVLNHKSIVTAEDANGNPSIYWQTSTGTFRISVSGQEFCGEDNIDLWANINLSATISAHSTFHPDKHQIWFFVAMNGSAYPNTRLVFDTRLGRVTEASGVRQGWAQHTGEACNAYCSFMFANTLGATVSKDLKPHIGYSGVGGSIWKCDTTDLSDNGNLFQAYLDSRSYAPWGLGRTGGMSHDAMLVANTSPGVEVTLTIYRDEGAESASFRASLTPTSDSQQELKVFPWFEGSALADSHSFRCRVGDDVARSGAWNLDGIIIPVVNQGTR